ncbi:MAG: hypothetical protein WCQ59_09145 [Candidatus Cloacimonadaceae bacterium]
MKKKDVNYKVITGMHAVGNQCKDCGGSTPADDVPNPNYMKCRRIDAYVKMTAHCILFTPREGGIS